MQGFSPLPKSKETVKKMVMEHGENIRTLVYREMEQLKKMGTRFSITFDEWTSTRNRSYMNINVHAGGQQFWSLGLLCVHGTMPADKCVELLESKLSAFGLSLKDEIVAICTDGASIMNKVGTLIDAEQQLCYAHGIQLAVLDVLYKQSGKRVSESEQETENSESESESSDSLSDDDNNQCSSNQDMKFEVIDDADLIA